MFPSPYGVSFILMFVTNIGLSGVQVLERFRLLTEYRSFLFYFIDMVNVPKEFYVSVSLRSIVHSYVGAPEVICVYQPKKFPSPYGVSFILILTHLCSIQLIFSRQFPSPYGVSFILIVCISYTKRWRRQSFRLLTEYRSFLW